MKLPGATRRWLVTAIPTATAYDISENPLVPFQVFRKAAQRPGTVPRESASLDGLRPIGSDFRRSGSSAITVILKML